MRDYSQRKKTEETTLPRCQVRMLKPQASGAGGIWHLRCFQGPECRDSPWDPAAQAPWEGELAATCPAWC